MLALALLLAASAHAEGPFPRKERKVYAPNADILAVNRSLSVSYLGSHLYYDEPSANTGLNTGTDYLDKEDGTLRGAKLAASWMTAKEQWYLHAEWAGAEGRVDYDGYLIPAAPAPLIPTKQTSRATTQDLMARAGKGFNLGERAMLTPHLSFGYRHWTREVAMGTPFSNGESYQHSFFAFGGMLQFAPCKRVVATADAAVGGTIHPTIKDQARGFDADLGTSALFKAGLELDGRVSRSLHLFGGFDFMGFDYGRSAMNSFSGLYEPDSKTRILNFNFGLRYSFNALT